MNHPIVRYVLVAVLIGLAVTAVSAALLSQNDHAVQGTLRFTEATIKPVTSLKWDPLTVPCPWNDTWCPNGDPPERQYRILVDLGHAERVTLDGAVSPNLDRSSNSRLFDWQDWAKDMRAQGYEVRVTTVKPITATELANTDLYIVAQPDTSKNGPVYFTQAEKDSIACFVLKGNTLLVMAQQFMGGKDQTQYLADMKTSYASAAVINDLLKGIHVEGRFTEGKVSAGVLDIMDSDSAGTQVFAGNPPDIWLPADGLKPEMKPDTFAGFHVLSIKPKTVQFLVRSDSTSFTSPKNMKYSPVVQAAGSRPIAIGLNGLGCGRVYLYGDPSAWQKETSFGKVYTEPKYHEQDAARVLVARMLSFNRTCEPCQAKEQPTQAQQTVKPTPTPKITRGITTTKNSCSSCIDSCDQNTEQGKLPNQSSERFSCYANQCGVKGDTVFEEDNLPYCNDCEYYAEDAAYKVVKDEEPPYDGYMDAYSSIYSDCVKMNACSCGSNDGWVEDCKDCINRCNKGDMSCLSKCKDSSGKVCISGETFADSCEICQTRCGSNQACLSECKGADGKPCSSGTLDVESCSACQEKCGSNQNCLNTCKDAAGKPCLSLTLDVDSCSVCQEKCGSDQTCLNNCKDANGQPCLSGTLDVDSCSACQEKCGSDQTCLKNCKDASGKPCLSLTLDVDSCEICQEKCGSDQTCLSKCKDASGNPCSSGTLDVNSCTSCLEKCGDDNMTCQNACKDPATGNPCIRVVGNTGSSSGCLSCYQACTSSAKTKNSAGGSEKTAEAVLSCQQKCDQQYDTTIAGCACKDTVCPSGQHKELQTGASLGCKCVKDITLTFNQTDLSSQWTSHNVGTPTGTSTGPGKVCRQVPSLCAGDVPPPCWITVCS